MHDGEIPYKLSFGEGIQPTDVAWLDVSQLPKDRYAELTGTELPDDARLSSVSLQMTGLAERESALLADVHQGDLEPHNSTLERMRQRLIRGGLKEEEAKHLVNVFALGILVGAKTVEITKQYADQGIRDLEENL
jgi:hypothetical protein